MATGEAAFLLYLRFLSCKQTPRTQQNFDAMMDSYIEQRARKDVSEESMQYMEDQMAAMQISFETCSEIDADYDLMAYYWLRTSADMGYLPAMIKYPVDGQQLFYPRLAFKQPELVMEFRNNAIRYLNQALHSGHPSAFLQYAYVYQYDSILDKDPYLIYAYTYAAKLAGFDPMLSGYVDQMLNSAELELDPGQVSDARRMGRDLCERYCRDSQS